MNTEQFDGHTPGPWYLNTPDPNPDRTVRWITGGIDEPCVCTDLLGATDADARLIAAAPDLLAEVKRLREENEELVKGVEFMTKRFIKSVEHSRRLQNALVTCAQIAGDDPFFNEGGEGYEALFGGEEE